MWGEFRGVFYPNEIASLLFGIVGALVILLFFRKENLPRFRYIFLAFLSILAANFFTVVEGVGWQDFFNFLEHLSYAIAGLIFAGACWSLGRGAR